MSEMFRFRGRTPGLAMRKAREELGDDARLVNARRVSGPGLPPLYEVQVMRAAAEARADETSALRRELAELREAVASLRPGGTTAPRAKRDRGRDVVVPVGVAVRAGCGEAKASSISIRASATSCSRCRGSF